MNPLKHKTLIVTIRPFVIAVMFLTLWGCASHSCYNLRKLDGSAGIKAYRDGISIAIRPFLLPNELKNYFGSDLIKKRILPVQFHIENGSSSDIGLDKKNFVFVEPDGHVVNSLGMEDAYKGAKDGYLPTAVWTVAFLDLGLFASAGNITDSNMKLDSDFQSKMLKNGVILKHRAADGIVFFRIKNSTRSLEKWQFFSKFLSLSKKEVIEISASL